MSAWGGLMQAWFTKPTIAAGSLWLLDSEENPFKKTEYKVEVIEMRDGWVNYRIVGSSSFQNEAMKVSNFRFCYKPLPYQYVPHRKESK